MYVILQLNKNGYHINGKKIIQKKKTDLLVILLLKIEYIITLTYLIFLRDFFNKNVFYDFSFRIFILLHLYFSHVHLIY